MQEIKLLMKQEGRQRTQQTSICSEFCCLECQLGILRTKEFMAPFEILYNTDDQFELDIHQKKDEEFVL